MRIHYVLSSEIVRPYVQIGFATAIAHNFAIQRLDIQTPGGIEESVFPEVASSKTHGYLMMQFGTEFVLKPRVRFSFAPGFRYSMNSAASQVNFRDHTLAFGLEAGISIAPDLGKH